MKLKNSLLAGVTALALFFGPAAPAAEKMQEQVTSYDQHKDGKPDHWVYQQAGRIYKREWDRNFDGKADFRTLENDGKLLEKQYDDNFDGKFEKIVKNPGQVSGEKPVVPLKKR